MSRTPFDFVNEITYGKNDLFEDGQSEKDYVPFIVNRALSYFADTALYANEMNQHNQLPKQWQFDFLRLSIGKKRRFSKWVKKGNVSADLAPISQYYKYSMRKAAEALELLTADQIEAIKQELDKGGR